jgi:hypothetical protein
MSIVVKYQVAIGAVFIWIGFIGAISFMEAWLKFRAPGVTLPLGLGIGRLVFGMLHKVELIISIVIIISIIYAGLNSSILIYLPLLFAFSIVLIQGFWLLPVLDTRADMLIQGQEVPPSNLHFVFIGAEVIKTICLLFFGINLLKVPK